MTAAYKKRAKGGWNKDKDVSNQRERNHEDHETKEQLEEISTKGHKVTKTPAMEKDASRKISKLRWFHKFSRGDVESLNQQTQNGDWWDRTRQKYYQEYKALLPEVREMVKAGELPNKILKQAREVLALFGE